MGKVGPLMWRAVLDTNVVVSALLFRGVASGLRDHWRSGRVRLLTSTETLGEVARVLRYPKFKLDADVVEAILATEVSPWCDIVTVTASPPACRDASDDKFLWCARDGKADVLVTGDPDLLALAPVWNGVPITTVADALSRSW